ncbi:Chaperonin-like RbcX protein [Rhynchospora pubera]|uniref:Chaperonin-like RbcX protein n=1 Tax=Rhynchospora pubera TaxID=906938 RepID=A0AAV8DKJ8_9POAL|nr:Chaperonin-like RbcX protein [Rhynchospora pubera]
MASARSVVIGSMALNRSGLNRRYALNRRPLMDSSFTGTWQDLPRSLRCQRKQKESKSSRLVVVDELAGQYEDAFEDVDQQLVHYFTYKAVRTVLHQLYEMNPPVYTWLYRFVGTNGASNGKVFLRALAKERQDLAERIMVTRLHLYGKWIKKCDHAKMYQKISDENLQLMRERLIETVIWPTDDTTTEKIG